MVYTTMHHARFWSKVDVKKSTTLCWNWLGSLSNGYGRIKVDGENMTASRMSWELFHGKELGEQWALHRCNNRTCCNPHHIYAGTQDDNARDVRLTNATKAMPRTVRSRVGRKLNSHMVLVARTRILAGERVVDIAEDLGVPYTTIHGLKTDRRWKGVWPDTYLNSQSNQ